MLNLLVVSFNSVYNVTIKQPIYKVETNISV